MAVEGYAPIRTSHKLPQPGEKVSGISSLYSQCAKFERKWQRDRKICSSTGGFFTRLSHFLGLYLEIVRFLRQVASLLQMQPASRFVSRDPKQSDHHASPTSHQMEGTRRERTFRVYSAYPCKSLFRSFSSSWILQTIEGISSVKTTSPHLIP